MQISKRMGSGCSLVGKAVASDSKGLRFEFSHRQKNIKCLLSDGTYIKQLIEKVLKNFVNTIFTLLVTTV